MLATATGAGTPRKTRSGVIRNPPPMPNIPDRNPTKAPIATRRGALTEISAMGR
jgi:hypothetical protein